MMHRRWRISTPVLGLILCGLSLMASAQADDTFGALINKAGRQRMLTQRIVLNYAQIGLGVFPEKSRGQLAADVALFSEQLAELQAVAPTTELIEALDSVGRQWQVFGATAMGAVSQSGARRLLFHDEDLLFATNKVVQLLQDLSGKPFSRLVNIAGRQRMLSQRLAKFYMLREWGIDTITTRAEMEQARNEFAGNLIALQNDAEATEEIRAELDEVAVQWTWFENALTLIEEDTFRLVVAESSQAILERMERVTGLYERLASR